MVNHDKAVDENLALAASGRLDSIAAACRTVYTIVAVVAYIGAFVAIVTAHDNRAQLGIGIGAAVAITLSLLPVLLLCRWAEAYAADLDIRSRMLGS